MKVQERHRDGSLLATCDRLDVVGDCLHEVDDLRSPVGGFDVGDADHFVATASTALSSQQIGQICARLCRAYRWQYVACGFAEPRFQALLGSLVSDAQMQRIHNALAPLLGVQPLQAGAQRQPQLVVVDRLEQHCA